MRARAQALLPGLRAGEKVAVVFFLYLSGLAWYRHLPVLPRLSLLIIPAAIYALGNWETDRSTARSRVIRDGLSVFLILAAYWSVGWFAAPPLTAWQEHWVGWDRTILGDWGVRGAIECAGRLFPTVLEIAYLCLYAVPMLCLGAVYWVGGRDRVHTFLFTLLLGTLTAYALLPLFPVHGPHIHYATMDLPQFPGIGRTFNVWVLDHMDIPTSVFPSGHVAVAFSSAFGLFRAVRERTALWASAFGVAILVYTATIYCRYHYAADGMASIAIAASVWAVSARGEDNGL